MDTMRGKITSLKKAKADTAPTRGCGSGFGFIRGEDGFDRFFHVNGVEGTTFDQLQEGMAVDFEPYEEKDRGLRARKVTIVTA